MSQGSTASTGLSFGSVLFFIFLIMKLTNYIDWSWWWVTAPLWLPIIVVLGIMGTLAALGGMMVLISAIVMHILERKSK